MENADLLVEAVRNSLEAGAGDILLRIDRCCGMADVVVSDDSPADIVDDAFSPGVSSKGPGRGRGLFLVREASEGRCGLEKKDGRSVLHFSVVLDGSLKNLSSTVPVLFNAFPHLVVEVLEDGILLYSLDGRSLEEDGISAETAIGMNRLEGLTEEKEKRSRQYGKADFRSASSD